MQIFENINQIPKLTEIRHSSEIKKNQGHFGILQK